MPYKYFVPVFLATASLLNSVEVKSATELNNAIIAANATPQGDPNIQFGSSFDFSQLVPPLLQPLNTDGVLNSVNNTFIIDGNGKTLTATPGTHRGFFARTSTGTVTIKNLTISSAIAKGGDGNNGGGGGLGAGGGLFLNENSIVILDNVSFQNCQATGGSSSQNSGFTTGGGGGGGLGGNGGVATSYGAGGGGGFSDNGGNATSEGGAGAGGFNGKGGNTSSSGGSGGGGGGFKGGNVSNNAGSGGAGDGGDGLPNGTGGSGSNGGIGGIAGSTGAGNSAGSGAVATANGTNGTTLSAGSLPGGGGGSNQGGGTGSSINSTKGGDGGSSFGGGGSGSVSSNLAVSGTGGNGGFGGGGGGTGGNIGGNGGQGTGGNGGFGGGGGGSGGTATKAGVSFIGNGGNGGFGGGGGFASWGGERGQSGAGGSGGFGAGGGGAPLGSASYPPGVPGAGGFAGGDGLSIDTVTGIGGGGAAMGADIFIENGAALTIRTGISFSGSQTTAGTGGNNGRAMGTNIFMMSEGSITVENLSNNSTVPYPIEGNIGDGGGNPVTGGGLTLGTGNTAAFTLHGANTYTGDTIINSGLLNLQGSVITPVTLNSGAFSGNASLIVQTPVTGTGNLTVNGGIVAPGGLNYGAISVGNDLLFTGGTFLTEFDSIGNADILDVSGTATLAGTLTVDNAEGNFLKGQTITVLEADGGIIGTFGTVNFPQSFDQPQLAIQYTGNTVELVVLRNHVFVRPIIDTGNPRHVAKYMLDQLPIDPNSDFGLVIRSLGVLSNKELNKTLNMMHQGVFGLFEFMNLTTNAQVMQMFNQPRFRLSAEEGSEPLSHLTASTKPFYPNTPVRRGCGRDVSKPHHVYFQPFGTWNSQSQKGELRGANYENAGFLTGYDYLFDDFYIGAGAGYAYTNFRWNGSAGKGHIHQVYGGLHGSYFNRYFSAILGSMLGGNFYETDRNIISSAPNHPNGALNRTAHSDNSGIQWTNHLGLIGDFSPLSVPLQIFANVDHFYLHNGSFNETGADSINLRVNSKTSNALRSELGLSSSYTFHVSAGCWTPYARISWVNKTLLSSSSYRGGFRGQVGTFSASATSKGTNQWAPGLGIEFANIHGFSLLLNSRAEINGKMKNYSADMRMEYAF